MNKILFFLLICFPLFAQERNLNLTKIPNQKPRNIIFILSDDHRYDYMSFMKNNVPWLKTPNLDRLRSEGSHIKQAFVTTALCSPSRASILTGMYTHQHTIVDNVSPEPQNLTYFPQYLQKAGYQTSFFGKWHMGSDESNPRKGFDKWVSFKGQGVYYNPVLNIDGREIITKDSTYTPTILTDLAKDWLEKRNKEKPFFMYLSHKSVHADFQASLTDLGSYSKEIITQPASIVLTDTSKDDGTKQFRNVPNWVQKQRYSWHGVDFAYHGQFDMEQIIRKYCETLTSMDKEIGRLLDYLDNNNLSKSTLVVYMGDNGFMFGEHGLIDKRTSYEESMRVPLLVKCPDLIQAGSSTEKMIQNIDIAPTILEMAGLKAPKYMVGRSFMPILQGKEIQNWRDRTFYEYYWEYDFPHTPTQFAIRTDNFKYIRYHGIWDSNEFYDLKADPNEMNNLIRDSRYQTQIKSMAEQLYDWLETTNGMQIPLKRTIKYRIGDHENKETY
ncbi:MAG: sulfatase family protein [Leadbetterella sp.]